ncbi:MAG: histidine kinase [Bacteroidetes bacterium]|nr:histidine kinase [Bacteroidota bacterium]
MLIFSLRVNTEVAAYDLIFILLLFGFGIILWYPISYLNYGNDKLSWLVVSHLFSGIVASALWLGLGYFIITSIIPNPDSYIKFFKETIAWRYLIGLMFYFLVTSFYYIIKYYTNLQERITREAELKNSITEAELRTLKFQINPHFIFNSLNSMSALTTIDPESARNMILKLADFLRYTLANNEKQKNLLSDELKNIKLYLDIEKIRFEDKFEYIEEINDNCLDVQIPNMILQPLFENVIKHAVYESFNKIILKMKCCKENSFLKITLENNYEQKSSSPKGNGIGLQNIKKRLELIYRYPDLLEVKNESNLFTVNLFIPV